MDKLYSPWRHNYVTKTAHAKKKEKSKNACVFCKEFKEKEDKKNLIIKRYKHSVIMLNAYPYNAGHILILPIKHIGELDNLEKKVRAEIMELINLTINVLTKVLKPQGLNVGLNLGEAGGGGIPSHLHFHILPRWKGDTNYLPTLANTKTISSDLYKVYDSLKEEFDKH